MIRHSDKSKNGRRGFTVLEIAFVIVISGLLFAAGTVMLRNYIMSMHMRVTRQHMAEIDEAITEYIRVGQKLPCVADLSAPADTITFGVEEGGGNCSTLTADSPNSFYVRTVNPARSAALPVATSVVIGAVPTRSLNIPDEDMADGWGNRFIYVVTAALASPPTGVGMASTQGGISINGSAGTSYVTPSDSANYLIISTGADGRGAFEGYPPAPGTAPSKLCPAGTAESANCAFEGDGATAVETFQTALVTGDICNTTPPPAACFDDYVSVGTANSGTLTSDTQVVNGLTGPNPPIAPANAGVNPVVPGTSITYADCPTGYIAIACSGISLSPATASCQGIPDTTDPGSGGNACQYSNCAASPAAYNFFTTCARF